MSFRDALGAMAQEENIDVMELLNALANSMLKAYKKRPDAAEDAEVEINPETGAIKIIGLVLDADGNITDEWDATPADFGRIVARNARQNLLDAIAEIRRRHMYEEFLNREGDIVSGTVLPVNEKFLDRYTKLNIGKGEAMMPRAEQINIEHLTEGQRVKVYIVEVRNTNQGPSIVVSRTHPALVAKLFEIEVPEIASGLVEIKALAREPGHRSKVAVASNDPDVDPVGACVGARGSRVRNITNELRNERVDIVPYSDDPVEFIQAALQPARIREVILDDETGTATVIVNDQQLSLAIGKEGQNARLAARLTGWRIDIRSDAEESEENVDADEASIEESEYSEDVVDVVETAEEGSEDAADEAADEEEVTE